MSSYDYVVFTLIILVFVYIGLNYKIIKPVDITFIIVSVVVLVYVYLSKRSSFIEHFADSTSSKIQIEEDVADINKTCVVYNTSFNSGSYTVNNGTKWNSIINPKGNKQLTFDLTPIYAPQNGFFLGNNRIVGPYSNSLGIEFLSTYTIMIACKHSNLVTNASSNGNEEIELIKLYANSPNNNGVVLYIQANSLSSENNVQVGSLMLQYIDESPIPCLIDKNHNYINFDRDVLTFYFIIKDTDNFRIQMMTETGSTISQILKFNVNNQDVTFANKEVVINRLKNWNGNLFNVAMFNSALSDDDVTKTYNHVMNEYMKRVDPNFTSVISTYNNTIDMVEELTKCPFGSTVCKNCQSVNRWYDINDVVNSAEPCKKSINEFCKSNPKHQWCKCWDSSSSLYNSVNCQLFRSIFTGKESLLQTLSDADLAVIMSKYNLLSSEDCKKNTESAVQQTWQQTKKIAEPTADRVKVIIHDGEDEKPKDSKGNIINYYSESDPSLDPKVLAKQQSQKDFSVNSLMHADINANFDPTQTIAFKEYQNIKNVLEQQQASGNVVNPAPKQQQSYFDKFLRVVMP